MADTSPASRPGRGRPVPGQRPTPACLASHHRGVPQPAAAAHHHDHQGHHEPHGHPGQELPIVEETSAGGLIIDAKDGQAYAAIIARRNRAGKLEWCLPKGHVEAGETPAQAATREIAEETGIEGQVLRHLGSIDYWFSGDDTRIHKIVHHFLL
ncbi:MAG: NUDIX hydrolase, partial [Bifidobacteriaceae bacterium]|nr:NUDIX hydrolase [Bifidobacteriaceae bacterium]